MALWGVEQQIRGRDPDNRQVAQSRASTPIIAELFERWQAELARIADGWPNRDLDALMPWNHQTG